MRRRFLLFYPAATISASSLSGGIGADVLARGRIV
jgi:hypothetical protein